MSEVKAIDAFETWLQGRMNLCVQGLTDRIARLEEENKELKERLSKDEVDEDAESKFDDQISEWFDRHNLLDYLEGRSIFDAIESYVEDCVAEKAAEVIQDLDIKLSVQ